VTIMEISGIKIEVIKKKIKNMHLSVLPPLGRVRISAPIGTNDETIKLFAIKKIGWIKKQIQKYKNQPRQSEREYVSGESHYLWGRRYRLELKYTKKANKVETKGSKLVLTVREASTQEQREKIMNEWYRAELKAKLPALIEKWEKIIGVKINDFGVKNMRTKWGTCNVKDKRIWINLQLAKKPVACLEYIVVHELVHLLEKNHTPVFIEYMDKFLPGWRVTKDELNGFIMDKYFEK
jgi:predicted metal-dependent hydrolase